MKEKFEKAIEEKEKYIENRIKNIQTNLREMKQWWKKGDEHEVYIRAVWTVSDAIGIREAIESIWALVDLWEELDENEGKD